MQPKGGEGEKCCYHPQHIIIGVCAFCLNERLLMLLLASNQQQHQQKDSKSNSFNLQLLKLFAFTNFLSRFDSFKNKKKTQQADDDDDEHGCSSGGSTSQEDSFISIKFDGSDGIGSWEKNNTKSKTSIEQQQQQKSSISSFNQIPLNTKRSDQGIVNPTTTSVIIEQSDPYEPFRWHKRIGHMFHVNRWKRPTKTNSKGKVKGHVPSNIEGHHVIVRHGWFRSLTKKRTKD